MPGLFAHSNHSLDIFEAMHKNAVLCQQLNTYYIDVRYPYKSKLTPLYTEVKYGR